MGDLGVQLLMGSPNPENVELEAIILQEIGDYIFHTVNSFVHLPATLAMKSGLHSVDIFLGKTHVTKINDTSSILSTIIRLGLRIF